MSSAKEGLATSEPTGAAEDGLTDPKSTGAALTDLLPVPAAIPDAAVEDVSNPTLSHALAKDHHEEKGRAVDPGEEVVDLGWNESGEAATQPLVHGIANEDLWLLVRRFNKQITHVKNVPDAPGNLDLNVSDNEEFSPEKLRAAVERFYMTVILGLLATVKHLARLRSWGETRRTSCFCAAYFTAWTFDFVTPLLITTAIVLIIHPPARRVLFPPAPMALVDSKSGTLQKPKAGVLASHETATGAPESFKGEAQEQEARNFFNGFSSVVITSATGSNPHKEAQSDSEESPADAVPDPSDLAIATAEAKDVAAGGQKGSKHDKTKVPVENTIWKAMRPFLAGVNTASDTFERLTNALSPTPPFPRDVYRLRLAALIMPLLIVSLFVTSYMVMKGVTFGIGFGFFGDPVIQRGLNLLNRRFPHWQKLLEVRNTILKGVPTNAQLTLTLLRIGEKNKAPIPPPPSTQEPPPERPAEVTDSHLDAAGSDAPLDATPEELASAMEHDPQAEDQEGVLDADGGKGPKHRKRGSRVLGFLKQATKGTVKSAIATDAARAKVGSHPARNRLGAVPKSSSQLFTGPLDFKGRYRGERGRVYITTKSTTPSVAFSADSKTGRVTGDAQGELKPLWSIAIEDVKELKKLGSFSFKAKILVGWSLGKEVNESLEITDETGTVRRVTAMPLRDELFNRLISIGSQKWEAW
ncbi:hypothetical protein GGR56DRAFT_643734 [Xylariaceae sp. FL0804]|nr:hypothetical protein GGR56DRAFT_643734 [Xylariaceae sp. FL0804]